MQIDLALPLRIMCLHFKVQAGTEVSMQFAEDAVDILCPDKLACFPGNLAPERDASSGHQYISRIQPVQQFQIHTGYAVEAILIGNGQDLSQLPASVLISGKETDVRIGIIRLMTIHHPIGFSTKDQLEGIISELFEKSFGLNERPKLEEVALITVLHAGENTVPQRLCPSGIVKIGYMTILEGREGVGIGLMIMVVLHAESDAIPDHAS